MNLDVNIDIKLPVITDNFNIVKTQLVDGLTKYDLIVDEDSVKTAKSMVTDINKLKKTIDDLRKSKVKDMSEPIKEFETKAKELTTLCEESKQKLLTQVKVFEDELREKCLDLVTDYKNEMEKKYGNKEGFEIEIPFDLAIVSNLTKTGISKKARDEIEERVLSAKNFQDKIEKRLLSLSSFCLKNGLTVALNREHINHFLMINDESKYEFNLLNLIQSELKREEQMRLKVKKESMTKVVAQNIADIPKTPTINVQPTQHKIQQPSNVKTIQKTKRFNMNSVEKTGIKKKYTVTAVFGIEADEGFEPHLENMLLDKFDAACIKTMPEITVTQESNDNETLLEDGSLF